MHDQYSIQDPAIHGGVRRLYLTVQVYGWLTSKHQNQTQGFNQKFAEGARIKTGQRKLCIGLSEN